MPLFDGILNGLLANTRLQNNRGALLQNAEREQGLFDSGLKRFRQARFDNKFRELQSQGLDPLRNSLSLFRNANTPDQAQAALGLFTSLRQPAASASLFDSAATGVPGLPSTATGLTRRGLGGLNAALGLEQQDLALGLSEVNNPALTLNQITGNSSVGTNNQPLLNSLSNLQNALAKFVGSEAAARVAGATRENLGRGGETPSVQTNAPVVVTPDGTVLTDPNAPTSPRRDVSMQGNAPTNTGVGLAPATIESSARAVKNAMVKLESARDALEATKNTQFADPAQIRRRENDVKVAEMELEKFQIEEDIAKVSGE